MKKTKRSYAIIVLLVILLVIAVGYAAFTATLTINGTATGTGTWDVHFKSVTLRNSAGDVDAQHGTATISTVDTTNDTITATITLEYPGDAVLLEAVIENSGSIPAKITGFTMEGADTDLLIEEAAPDENEVIAGNGTCTTQFVIKWAADSTATTLSKTFTITFDYVQATTEVNITPNHSDAVI